jgi:hypothetical protein
MGNCNWVFVLLILVISCVKDKEFNYPLLFTGEVTDINNDGAVFNLRINDLGKSDIIDFGFVWDSKPAPTIAGAEKYLIQGVPATGVYSEQITTTLQEGVTYHVRSFARNVSYITYGQEVTFVSLGSTAPQISDFMPKTGNIGDTIVIHGKNFSYKLLNNVISLGQFHPKATKATQDSLIITVPQELNTESSDLSVSINNHKTTALSKFHLIKPIVTDFNPKTAPFSSTITISGENFAANKKDLKVFFGDFKASIISLTNNKIEIIVPPELDKDKCFVKVRMNNLTDSIADFFSIVMPTINDFYPRMAPFGSNIRITGQNFDGNKEHTSIFLDKIKAEIVEFNSTYIIVKVPDSLNVRQASLSLDINGMLKPAKEKFTLSSLELADFYPKIVLTGATLTIKGKNFSPIAAYNLVNLGGLKATIEKASIDQLEVKVPLQNIGYYSSRDNPIGVEVIGENLAFTETLLINDKWFRHKDSPIEFSGSFYVQVNNKAYLGINESKGFWEYDPVNDEYKKLNNFPGSPRQEGSGFSINNKIYYGTGFENFVNFKDFWEYDIATGSWTQKSDFKGQARTGSTSFSINGFGYLGGGHFNELSVYNHPFDDFWKYNPLNDAWSRIPSFLCNDSSKVFGMANGISVVVGKIAYFGMGWNYTSAPFGQMERWFIYNSVTNTWNQLTNFPKSRTYQNAIAFQLNGVPYVKTVTSDFYLFDGASNDWQRITTDLIPNNITGIGFSIGNIAYVGIGQTLWEYDPSR